jgi:signal transduction histidine kinase
MHSPTQTETARRSTPSHAPELPLQGYLLIVARTGWVMVALVTIICFFLSIPVEFARLQTVCMSGACEQPSLTINNVRELQAGGLSIDFFAVYFLVLEVMSTLTWLAIGSIIFWRKSNDRMVMLASLWLITLGVELGFGTQNLGTVHPIWGLAGTRVYLIASASFGFVLYLFPSGQFVPRWTRFLAVAAAILQVPIFFLTNAPLTPDKWLPLVAFGVWAGLLGSGLYAQIYRYRRVSNAIQRQQTKWVVFTVTIVLTCFLGEGVASIFIHTMPLFSVFMVSTVTYLAMLLLPLSVGIAVLRYHLWDIDMLINRTLVYGLLTACVIGLYVLIVGGLSTAFQGQGNLVLSLGATALIAVLFEPFRHRLQRRINRLMYGERDDPYRILSRLGQRLEATLVPEQVLPTIVQITVQALKLPYVAVTVKQDEAVVTVASSGTLTTDLVRLPLSYQGEHIGELLLAPRAPGEAFTPADRRLLTDLARQAGIAVYAVRLTTDLQRLARDLQHSRTELVTTREEERRRLRRDLHDGLGSVLTSLNLRAGAVRVLLARDPAAADALVVEQQSAIRSAIADIRRLVYDLRPPSLDELGLLGAIRERAAHFGSAAGQPLQQEHPSGLRVEVQAPQEVPALSAALEVATYRIVQEALSNVARHAHAHTCTICLTLSEGLLQVEISDDGIGLPAAPRRGVGWLSMRERAAELGGTCQIEAMPAGGTQVCARLPLLPEA